MNINAFSYRFQTLINNAGSILIFLKAKPDFDYIASALALYLSLTAKGKQVKVLCPDKLTVEYSSLFAVDMITDEFGSNGKNLVISFPYTEGSIEKVSSNIQNGIFNLVVEPRSGFEPVKQESIAYSRSGEGADNFDLVIMIGVTVAEQLGKFQQNIMAMIKQKQSIVIDRDNGNVQIGSLKIIGSGNSSVAEIMTLLLFRSNMPVDQDISGNLIKGIKFKTNNFASASADAFEAAAICSRINALPSETASDQAGSPAASFDQPPYYQNQNPLSRPTPPDWLKPKIYRSSANNASIDSNKGSIL